MTAPPAYPRVAHLVAGRGTRDDLVLGPTEVADLLAQPVVVEEKLDGANVVLWLEAGQVTCALRSGPGAMDRAGQLGPLRAWLAQHDEAVRRVVADGSALYAEWLLLTHSVSYNRLPGYLVALDLWRAESSPLPVLAPESPGGGRSPGARTSPGGPGPGQFVGVDERNQVCRAAGLATPPELWRGVAGTAAVVEGLMGPSTWGPEPMEGVVVRRLGEGAPRLAKILRAGFDRLDDDGWRQGRRPRNRLADQEASWR
jgi:hypothetical protein